MRRTTAADLDFVMALEHHDDQRPYIGQWPREQHEAALARPDWEHWIIANAKDGSPLGYIIAFDVRHTGEGIYVKRIAVTDKSRGIGREALQALVDHAFHDLGAESVCLAVRHHNERARRMYRALGFADVAQTPDERRLFNQTVDAFGDECAVMRVTKR